LKRFQGDTKILDSKNKLNKSGGASETKNVNKEPKIRPHKNLKMTK
jgi:hypothetical protein